jgi:hypothetical protein
VLVSSKLALVRHSRPRRSTARSVTSAPAPMSFTSLGMVATGSPCSTDHQVWQFCMPNRDLIQPAL